MKSKYCYWSVCDGAYGAMMEHCVMTSPDESEKVESSGGCAPSESVAKTKRMPGSILSG